MTEEEGLGPSDGLQLEEPVGGDETSTMGLGVPEGELRADALGPSVDRLAMLHLQRQGRYTGGFRPTGWEVGSDRLLQAHPEEELLVARAQQLRRTGIGLRKVARLLLEEGFVPTTGTQFHPEQIRRWTR